MKKLLPTLVNSYESLVGRKDKKVSTDYELRTKNSRGFTLIELLVVVAIIAILTIIAISLYSGIQTRSRDSRRRAEVDSLAKSIEALKNPTNGKYVYAAADYTKDYPQAKPQDPKAGWTSYCYASSALLSTPPAPVVYDSWPTTGCPTNWNAIPAPVPPASADIFTSGQASWTICAKLEDGTTIFCKTSLTN